MSSALEEQVAELRIAHRTRLQDAEVSSRTARGCAAGFVCGRRGLRKSAGGVAGQMGEGARAHASSESWWGGGCYSLKRTACYSLLRASTVPSTVRGNLLLL